MCFFFPSYFSFGINAKIFIVLLGEGKGNPLHYSCLENPMDRENWWAIVMGLQESNKTEATWQQHQYLVRVWNMFVEIKEDIYLYYRSINYRFFYITVD